MARLADRYRLMAHLPRRGTGAEVGVWKGDFSAQLLRFNRPQKLYLVDPWTAFEKPGYERAAYGGRSGGEDRMQSIHDSVAGRFSRQCRDGRVVMLRMDSQQAAVELGEQRFDWIYIDADHTYDAVKRDLENFRALIRPGGILAGDDYGVRGWWEDGVKRAVDDFAREVGLEPVLYGCQFLIRVP